MFPFEGLLTCVVMALGTGKQSCFARREVGATMLLVTSRATMPASRCGWITVATNASALWQEAQLASILPLSEWQVVHEFAFARAAIGGSIVSWLVAWAFESGAGAYALAYR